MLFSLSAILLAASPVSIAVFEDTLVMIPCRNFFGSRRWGLLIVRGVLLMGGHGISRENLRQAHESMSCSERANSDLSNWRGTSTACGTHPTCRWPRRRARWARQAGG